MVRKANRLTARTVASKTAPGLYGDGNNLYLQVNRQGARSWVFRYMSNGKARGMGLGPVDAVTLAEARQAALEARKLLLAGMDPIEHKRARKAAQADTITFWEAAKAYIETHKSAWRNEKHADQWESTLRTYAKPILGNRDVRGIEPGHVLRVIKPIWETKRETASRVRGRIESVLDWATANKYREGDNPARWKGNLAHSLPRRAKLATEKHFPALPYGEVATFMADLRTQQGASARALEFAILTASRSKPVRLAKWNEIDLKAKLWTVPAENMKAGRPHTVPLSDRAASILKELAATKESEFVFPSTKPRKGLSDMAMTALIRRMHKVSLAAGGKGYTDKDGEVITAHGFRSSFRDWASEQTAFASEVSEMALAHVVSNKVEAAYRRGDLLEKRRRLMDEWAKYCGLISLKHETVTPKGHKSAQIRKIPSGLKPISSTLSST